MTAKQKSALSPLRAGSAILLVLSVAGLTGCADADIAQLEDTLAAIRHSPGGQPPVIAVALPESQQLSYLYSDERSPFLPPETVAQESIRGHAGVAPDPQRVPEPLERFALQELRLVGTIHMGGRQLALIASPDGNVASVKEGNYLGTDYGRIVQIKTQEIRLTERVFAPREGWQERQVSLVINDNSE